MDIEKVLTAGESVMAEFKERFGGFLVIFNKDIYTEEYLAKSGLNERQIKAVVYVREKGRITNKEYNGMFDITDRMALIDLSELCAKEIFERIGKTGRKTEYILTRKTRNKPEINPTNPTQTRNKPDKPGTNPT